MNLLAKLLSQREVADQLNVSERTIVRWRHEHGFPEPHRIGKRNYYRPEEVNEWIQSPSMK